MSQGEKLPLVTGPFDASSSICENVPSFSAQQSNGSVTFCEMLQSFETTSEWQGACFSSGDTEMRDPLEWSTTAFQIGLSSIKYYNVIFCLSKSTESQKRAMVLRQFISLFSTVPPTVSSLVNDSKSRKNVSASKSRNKVAILVKSVQELTIVSSACVEFSQHSFFVFHGGDDIRHALAIDFKSLFEHCSILVTTIYHFLDALRHGFAHLQEFEGIYCDDISFGSHSHHAYRMLMKEFMTPKLTPVRSETTASSVSPTAAQKLPRLVALMEPLALRTISKESMQEGQKLFSRVKELSQTFHARLVVLDPEFDKMLMDCSKASLALVEPQAANHVSFFIRSDAQPDTNDLDFLASQAPLLSCLCSSLTRKLDSVLGLYRRQLAWMSVANVPSSSKVTLVIVAETAHVVPLRDLLHAYQEHHASQHAAAHNCTPCLPHMPVILHAASLEHWPDTLSSLLKPLQHSPATPSCNPDDSRVWHRTIVLPFHLIRSVAMSLLEQQQSSSGMELQCLVLDLPSTMATVIDLYGWHCDAQFHARKQVAVGKSALDHTVATRGPKLTFLVPGSALSLTEQTKTTESLSMANEIPCTMEGIFLHHVAQWKLAVASQRSHPIASVLDEHAANLTLPYTPSLRHWTKPSILDVMIEDGGVMMEDGSESPLPALVNRRTGATLNLYCASELLQRFCQYLPRDEHPDTDDDAQSSKRTFAQMSVSDEEIVVMGNPALAQSEHYRCQPLYETVSLATKPRRTAQRKESHERYMCQVRLPTLLPRPWQHLAATPIQGVECRSKALARMTAAYQAVLVLLENELLDDHLLPCESIITRRQPRMAKTTLPMDQAQESMTANKRYVYYPIELDGQMTLDYPRRIPRAFQSTLPAESNTYYVYRLDMCSDTTSLSASSTLGLFTRHPLPENMPSFWLFTPSSRSTIPTLVPPDEQARSQADMRQCRIHPIASIPLTLSLEEFRLILCFQPLFFKLLSTRNSMLMQSTANGNTSQASYVALLKAMRLEMKQAGSLAEPSLFPVPDDKKVHYLIAPLTLASKTPRAHLLSMEHIYYEQYNCFAANSRVDTEPATTAMPNWVLDWCMIKRATLNGPSPTLKELLERLGALFTAQQAKTRPPQGPAELEALIRHACAQSLVHDEHKDVIYTVSACHFDAVSDSEMSTKAPLLPSMVRVDRLKKFQNYLTPRGSPQSSLDHHGPRTVEMTAAHERSSENKRLMDLERLCMMRSVFVIGGDRVLTDKDLPYNLATGSTRQGMLDKESGPDEILKWPERRLIPLAASCGHDERHPVMANDMVRPDSVHVWPLDREMLEWATLLPSILHQVFFYANVDDFFMLSGLQTALTARPRLMTSVEALTGPSPGYRRPRLSSRNASGREESMALPNMMPFDYERLEILGDSLLKLSVSADLFLGHPQASAGQLTVKRAKLVSNTNLFHIGYHTWHLPSVADLSGFVPRTWSPPHLSSLFAQAARDCSVATTLLTWPLRPLFDECLYWYELQLLCDASERRDTTPRPPMPLQARLYGAVDHHRQYAFKYGSKTIADMVESLIGAYYLDCGMRPAQKLMQHVGLLSGPVLDARWDTLIEPNFGLAHATSAVSDASAGGSPPWTLLFPPSPAYLASRSKLRNAPPPDMEHLYTREPPIDELEARLGHRFRDRRLLYLALTHWSFCTERSYDRLEFLGDAVLDWAVTCYYYETYTELSPGRLTELRATAVSNESYARLAVYLGLPAYIKWVSNDATRQEFSRFLFRVKQEQRLDSDTLLHDHLTHSRFISLEMNVPCPSLDDDKVVHVDTNAPKLLGDVFESLAGAVYLDLQGDMDGFWSIYKTILVNFLEQVASPLHDMICQ